MTGFLVCIHSPRTDRNRSETIGLLSKINVGVSATTLIYAPLGLHLSPHSAYMFNKKGISNSGVVYTIQLFFRRGRPVLIGFEIFFTYHEGYPPHLLTAHHAYPLPGN